MYKIVVLNSKGGSGKTTVATNLASYYATRAFRPALMDLDAQGSSARWLEVRPQTSARIHGISAYKRDDRVTKTFQHRVPRGTQRLIVDTPAALDSMKFEEVTRGADAIVVPILPSDIDIHASARVISKLLTAGRIDRREGRLCIVANRVRINTRSYDSLKRFLDSLHIPIVSRFRDTQNYVFAAERGLGLFELPQYRVKQDREEWSKLIHWLETRRARHLQTVVQA